MNYMIQIAAITAIAELLLRAVPVHAAGFRYAYWRLVLLAAIVMPWVLRSTRDAPVESAGAAAASAVPAAAAIQLPIPATEWTAAEAVEPSLLLWLLAAGIAARLIWVAAGLLRLRTLRRRSTPLADEMYDEIQQTLGTRADVRSVSGLAQPVTFGLRRPVVLLPEDLTASREIRRAVVTHELVHVQRRDWLWVIAEEALRAVLWFHPAIWWLTSRIQLAREEFTDHLTVLATGSRRTYMEALLAFCDADRLAPAPAFARRPHLFHRIVLLSKEAAMSSRRIVVSGAVITALLATGGWYASEAFPVVKAPVLRAAAPAPLQQGAAGTQQVNSVTPENPIPRRLFSTPVPYPQELAGTGFSGAVELTVVLNAGGSVASVTGGASAISLAGARSGSAGPPQPGREVMTAFSEAAIASIRQWQYDPPVNAPLQFFVVASFAAGQNATISQSDMARGVTAGRGVARVTTPAEQSRFTEYVRDTQRSLEVVAAETGGTPIRVGGDVTAPRQIRKINPEYPPIAMSARVQGVVILEIVVDPQGRVSAARILRSIPLLDRAALDAVYQWEYEPTLLNGAPVSVITTVTVQFTL